MHLLTQMPQYLDYYSLVVSFEIWKYEFSNMFFFQDCFGNSEFLAFPYEFYDQLVTFYKESTLDFDKGFVKSVDQLGKCCYLNSSKSDP